MKTWRLSFTAVAFAALLSLSACTTVNETGRRQLNMVSASEETQLGLTAFEEMKKDLPLSKDTQINALVQKVGKRIAAVADLPGAQWEFVVFESKDANAFCLPGGKVGIYTGILPITKDEAGLATVIGHEVAHASLHHGAERMSEAMALQMGGQLVGTAVNAFNPQWTQMANTLYGAGATVGRALPHSRAQESEADRVGLRYMARAGYDPATAVAFWQRFANHKGGESGGPWFLRTHPLDSKRVEDLQKWIPEAKAQAGTGATMTPGSQVIGRPK